jgi:hypothetical protein
MSGVFKLCQIFIALRRIHQQDALKFLQLRTRLRVHNHSRTPHVGNLAPGVRRAKHIQLSQTYAGHFVREWNAANRAPECLRAEERIAQFAALITFGLGQFALNQGNQFGAPNINELFAKYGDVESLSFYCCVEIGQH